MFLASLVALREGLATGRLAMFAASGLLAGLASQFRPNLLPFPAFAAVVAWALDRQGRKLARPLMLYVVMAAAVSVPWIARNYRLTGDFIPPARMAAFSCARIAPPGPTDQPLQSAFRSKPRRSTTRASPIARSSSPRRLGNAHQVRRAPG